MTVRWVLRLSWALALALTPVAAGACSSPPPTDSMQVSGLVLDARNEAGIAKAKVTFVSDTLYTESTTTNGDGFYRMDVETDTRFGEVRAEKAGWQTAERTVYFDSRTRRLDLRLRPADGSGGSE